jgi:hypothetical protein
MKEKKGLEWEMKHGRLVTYVLPIGFGVFSFESVSYFTGASGRSRTGDLLITNQLLYQLSYAGFHCSRECIAKS